MESRGVVILGEGSEARMIWQIGIAAYKSLFGRSGWKPHRLLRCLAPTTNAAVASSSPDPGFYSPTARPSDVAESDTARPGCASPPRSARASRA